MFIKNLQLVNFKNYSEAELTFSTELNCIVGENGSGKTNILDAIYYLSMCKSYLNPIDSQNIKFDEHFFLLQSFWEKDGTTSEVYCSAKKGQKKIIKRNKVNYEKLADHIGLYPVVMISPYDRNLILEGGEVRRKWIDSTISQFDKPYLDVLMRYTKVLSQRNALLKNKQKTNFFDAESFEVWDEQLVDLGNIISKKRTTFLEKFIPLFQQYYEFLGNDAEQVCLSYVSQLETADFAELLAQKRRKDEIMGYTTVGVHKDDLSFLLNQYPIKKFGSQGQQKSYLIALKLAQYEYLKKTLNIAPILLLDDIFDKLDQQRVQKLMKLVSNDSFGQVFVTDTNEERLKRIFQKIDKKVTFFTVSKAKITTHA